MSCGAAPAICGSTCCKEKCCGTTCCNPFNGLSLGSCCGETCCDLSTSICCGSVCCDKDTSFCCGDGTCCKSSDACGVVLDDSGNTRRVCTRMGGEFANMTVTVGLGGSTGLSSVDFATTTTTSVSSGSRSLTLVSSSTIASSTPTTTGAGDSGVSGGTIAGAVIGPLCGIALLAIAFILWNRRRKNRGKEIEELEMYQPAGGRHELGAEAEEKNHPQLGGNEINEMFAPPDEAGGEVIYELPGEGQPAEMGPDSPLTQRTTWEGAVQEREHI